MLDKTIPFYTIIMKRSFAPLDYNIVLPKNYKIRNYQNGDEKYWAEIEKSVLEFDSLDSALECHKNYLAYLDDLKKRQWFVENASGKVVATSTGWFLDISNKQVPVVHGIACLPKEQGKGLGKAVVAQMIKTFYELDKGKDIWLETQTWSYKAIGVYLELGFVPMKTAEFNKTKNEYQKALIVLKDKMQPDLYQKFISLAK